MADSTQPQDGQKTTSQAPEKYTDFRIFELEYKHVADQTKTCATALYQIAIAYCAILAGLGSFLLVQIMQVSGKSAAGGKLVLSVTDWYKPGSSIKSFVLLSFVANFVYWFVYLGFAGTLAMAASRLAKLRNLFIVPFPDEGFPGKAQAYIVTVGLLMDMAVPASICVYLGQQSGELWLAIACWALVVGPLVGLLVPAWKSFKVVIEARNHQ